MGSITATTYTFKKIMKFPQIVEKVLKYDKLVQISRSEFKDKGFVLKFCHSDFIYDSGRSKTYKKFQTVFRMLDENTISISTEYAFLLSLSDFNDAIKINDIWKDFFSKLDSNEETIIDAEFKDSFNENANKLLKAKELLDKGAIDQFEYDKLKDKFMEESLK